MYCILESKNKTKCIKEKKDLTPETSLNSLLLFLNLHLPSTVSGTHPTIYNVYRTKIKSTLYYYFDHSILLWSTKAIC